MNFEKTVGAEAGVRLKTEGLGSEWEFIRAEVMRKLKEKILATRKPTVVDEHTVHALDQGIAELVDPVMGRYAAQVNEELHTASKRLRKARGEEGIERSVEETAKNIADILLADIKRDVVEKRFLSQ